MSEFLDSFLQKQKLVLVCFRQSYLFCNLSWFGNATWVSG